MCEKNLSRYDFALLGAKELSTYGGGGRAKVFLPKTKEELVELFGMLRGKCALIGGGSNVLVDDGELDYPLISTRRLDKIDIFGDEIVCECGARIASLISASESLGRGGFEFLCGVPATVGGALKMNAGAFGACVCDLALEVETLKDGRVTASPPDKSKVGYRKGVDGVVLSCRFKLENGKGAVEKKREYLKWRKSRQPKLPSLGSVFKNGERPAGMLLDMCGLKGKRMGGAMVSFEHANVIVNVGGGTARDYLALSEIMRREVEDKFGITLEREFEFLKRTKI